MTDPGASANPLRRVRDWIEARPLLALVAPTVLALGAVAGLAYLAGSERIEAAHLAEAVQYRPRHVM